MDFAGTRRRRAVRRRRGARPDDRARLRPARARLRGAARGRGRRRGAHGHDHLPRGLPGATELAGQEAEFAVTVARGQGQAAARARRRARRPRPASTRSTSCARTSARGWPRPRRARIEAEFREAALDAAVAAATIEVPDALVEARAREMWDSMLHSLSHQGIDRETYLRHLRPRPRRRRSSRPSRTPSRRCAARRCWPRSPRPSRSSRPRRRCSRRSREARARASSVSPKKLLERLKSNGRLDSLKEDLAQRKALDLVAESAKPVPVEPAQARKLLTSTPRRSRSWPNDPGSDRASTRC